MFLIIDNQDSFVYNLAACFKEEGAEVKVIRNNFLEFLALDINEFEGIVISPGPKKPKDYSLCCEMIKKFYTKIPIFGVCLGHQIIAYTFGADVGKAKKPMHGKVEKIKNNSKNLFKDLPTEFNVTRYHSLVIKDSLPNDFDVDAVSTQDNSIMAISHKNYPLYGLQFHPEAVLTEYGNELIKNFINLAKNWKISNEN